MRTGECRPGVVRMLPPSRNRLLWGACAAGLVHATFSLYWAPGGRWLLGTVGEWAVEWAQQPPVTAGLALLAVAATKVAGAVVPLLVESGRLPWRGFLRTVCAAGAGVLIVYGVLNTFVGWAALGGLVDARVGVDRAAAVAMPPSGTRSSCCGDCLLAGACG